MGDLQFDRADRRLSNIELLRIIAMLIIVAHHFSVHGEFDFPIETVTFNKLWVQFIQIGGKIGVDIFVLISGYFLVTSYIIKINKLIKLWIQIFTYSILIFVVFIAFGIEPFGMKELVMHILPVTFSQWWFASSYFVLYLISPYLNKLLRSLDKKAYQRMLALLSVCWCIIPTFLAKPFESNNLLWFVYLYALSGYVKIHAIKTKISGIHYIIASLIITILTFLSAIVFDLLGTIIPFFGNHATFFYDMQRLPIVLISVFLFLGFLKVSIKYNRFINIISSATFGVYLIHDNGYVRSFMWKALFKNSTFSESSILIPYSMMVIATVFSVCTVVELFRIYILEKHYMTAINSIATFIGKHIDRFFNLKFFDKI